MDTFINDIKDILELIPNSPTNEDKIERIKNNLKLIEKNKKSTEHFKNKILVLISFAKFIENYCNTSVKIYGSFVRQIFEKIFIEKYDETGYGDMENHDIDITIYKNEDEFIDRKQTFNGLIDMFYILSKLKFDEKLNFEGFSLVKINDLTISKNDDKIHINSLYPHELDDDDTLFKYLNNPHYHFILKNNNLDEYVIFDMFAYPIVIQDEYNLDKDINVNKLILTTKGITTEFDFFTTLHGIIKREGICNINFNKIIENLKHMVLTFDEKKKLYNQILQFIVFRTKILSVGYDKITSNYLLCDIEIEYKEKCSLTELSPPYIKIKLECGHYLSVMGMAGITNIQTNEFTEQVVCPYCREKLIPNVKINPTTDIKMPNVDLILNLETDIEDRIRFDEIYLNIEKYQQNELMSQSNFIEVYNHIGIKNKE